MIKIKFTLQSDKILQNIRERNLVLKKRIANNRSEIQKKLFEITRNAIKRSSSKSIKKTKTQLFTPTGEKINDSIAKFINGKIIGKGKLNGKSIKTPLNKQEYRWTKSKPDKPSSHVSGKGKGDHWLRNAVKTEIDHDTIYVYVNPDSGKGVATETSQLMPEIIEKGGYYKWNRNIPIGYIVETYEGTWTKRGNGINFRKGDKNAEMQLEYRTRTSIKGKKFLALSNVRVQRAKNKTGRTQKEHFRKFKKAHVSFRQKYLWINKNSKMNERPFIGPSIQKIMRNFVQMNENIFQK